MEQNGGDEKENYLAHYGVVGMRWGIRRYQPYSYTGARRSGRAGKEIGEAAKLGKKAAKAVGRGAKVAGKTVASGVKKYREYRRERKRQDLINNGTISDLKSNRGKLLSEDDIKAAIQRIKDNTTLDELARDAHMKAIKRGKDALNLTKDFLVAGWGVYSSYRQIKGEQVDRAIDAAVANDDLAALKTIRNRKGIGRKNLKEVDDYIRKLEYDKPLEKAYLKGDRTAIDELRKNAPDKKAYDEAGNLSKELRTSQEHGKYKRLIDYAIRSEDVSMFDLVKEHASDDDKARMAKVMENEKKRHKTNNSDGNGQSRDELLSRISELEEELEKNKK